MTKEEHLKEKGITEATGFHSYGYLYESTLEAMESYATDRLDSYKESLRLAIEEQRSGFPSKNHFLFTAKEVLDLINSVTPKE